MKLPSRLLPLALLAFLGLGFAGDAVAKSSGSKRVYVRSYVKKDGTVVPAHTRSAPGSGTSVSSGSSHITSGSTTTTVSPAAASVSAPAVEGAAPVPAPAVETARAGPVVQAPAEVAIGMTFAEVRAILGEPQREWTFRTLPGATRRDFLAVVVTFQDGRVDKLLPR